MGRKTRSAEECLHALITTSQSNSCIKSDDCDSGSVLDCTNIDYHLENLQGIHMIAHPPVGFSAL